METLMQTFDVQSISINAPLDVVFAYISQPENLPQWTHAFARADARSALLRTPQGEVEITLETLVSQAAGSVDWRMTYPDGSVGMAYSRVVPDGPSVIYSFTLMAPPLPLEELEGALNAQSAILAGELKILKTHLEAL